MRNDFFKSTFILLILTIVSCAKRGSIDGGQKDTIAPILTMSFPKNGSINFKTNEIKLTFDEYVMLKDLNKQLIISPPMKRQPEILPTTASKFITIKIKDTLLPNTTYSFNFGQSIQDFNEGNPYKQFKYVFSTGSFIDSLKLNGKIKDAYNKNPDNFVTVMLYEVNEKFKDSVVYKQNPRYVTNTLDSLKVFQLQNIKAGKYLLVALKDKNNNYKFDSREDKIGFQKEFISIPNDTVFELELFKEAFPVKVLKPKQASGNRLILPYEGKLKNPKIVLKNKDEILQTIVTKFSEKDSLQIWYKPIKTDSLQVIVDKESFKIKVKDQKKDSLILSPSHRDNLDFRDSFSINSTLPIDKFDVDKILILNKDSVKVSFTTDYDIFDSKLMLNFKKEPSEKYKIKIQKDAISSYLNQTNKEIIYKITTKNTTDYGNLRLVLKKIKSYPVIVELTDEKGKTIYSDYLEKAGLPNFDLIDPAQYTLRLIYDTNKNKEWDTGNYLEKRQSEEVIYYPKLIDIRANWDVEQEWSLQK
jgi:uncharacterized protein (DUF2141 family)